MLTLKRLELHIFAFSTDGEAGSDVIVMIAHAVNEPRLTQDAAVFPCNYECDWRYVHKLLVHPFICFKV